MEQLFFLVWFILVLLGLFSNIKLQIPKYMKYTKTTGGIVNYNPTLRKFVYKVYMTKEEIISSLKIINVKDELSCAFDFEKDIIIFSGLEVLKKNFFMRFKNTKASLS